MMRAGVFLGLLAMVLLTHDALADQEAPYNFEEKPWVEAETLLPAFPQEANLIEFYVGPTERNRFFVDGSTINIGTDGVVRYVVVLKAAGGATNVALEAMRCAAREIKLIAFGRANATWEKINAPQWRPIENKLINQYRAVLNREYLCPSGSTSRDAEEARASLRRGKAAGVP
jgi:hypothetical protein